MAPRTAACQRRQFAAALQRDERGASRNQAACRASSSRACRLPVLMPQGTPEAISVYDTSPLRATLLELVDFDLLNSGPVRVSLGAVQVKTGNMKYFDTARGQPSARSMSWRAARCRRAFHPSKSTTSPIGTAVSSPTRRCNIVLEKKRPASKTWSSSRSILFSAKGPVPANSVRDRPAGEGDPLFEPHAPQHRYLLRAPGYS